MWARAWIRKVLTSVIVAVLFMDFAALRGGLQLDAAGRFASVRRRTLGFAPGGGAASIQSLGSHIASGYPRSVAPHRPRYVRKRTDGLFQRRPCSRAIS